LRPYPFCDKVYKYLTQHLKTVHEMSRKEASCRQRRGGAEEDTPPLPSPGLFEIGGEGGPSPTKGPSSERGRPGLKIFYFFRIAIQNCITLTQNTNSSLPQNTHSFLSFVRYNNEISLARSRLDSLIARQPKQRRRPKQTRGQRQKKHQTRARRRWLVARRGCDTTAAIIIRIRGRRNCARRAARGAT
jgi:hypothetical protein